EAEEPDDEPGDGTAFHHGSKHVPREAEDGRHSGSFLMRLQALESTLRLDSGGHTRGMVTTSARVEAWVREWHLWWRPRLRPACRARLAALWRRPVPHCAVPRAARPRRPLHRPQTRR